MELLRFILDNLTYNDIFEVDAVDRAPFPVVFVP
jgi:hypothetical protein